ncbi:hypothetical protein [Daejeonella sp.]|uniref:hypothetical protein n=1 Tax=Daejeonella sp. TaxID=2805397 RepID=UPI0030C33A28
MKYLLLLFFAIVLLIKPAGAQITLNLALNNRPQPWLSDWVNPVNGQMIISYMQGPALNDPSVKLRSSLLDERGSIIGASNINAARIYILRAGVNQFTIADALQLQNLVFQGNLQNTLQHTGRLPAGQYQLRVEILNTAGDIVRARQTRPFFITSYQLPILMQPASGSILDARLAQNIIIFRWTSLIPGSPDLPQYRVQVFEILPGQTPMQAFRGNRPLLNEISTKGSTQYIWRTQLPMLDSTANKQFIWTVQTLDRRGQPIPGMDTNIQGRSEPAIFNIVNQMGNMDKNRKNEDSIKN